MMSTVRSWETFPLHLAGALPKALLVAAILVVLSATMTFAHTPVVDSDLADWCIGAASNGVSGARVEDSSAELTCGNCSITTDLACTVASDCPGGEVCQNLTSKTEIVFWDNRTDGAVNDLATVSMTWDATNLYIAAELWVDPDPVSLPFGQIALDFQAGGINRWHDPLNRMDSNGRCSLSTDRACTNDDDCSFCAISEEPVGGRVRACGSGCSDTIPGDDCLSGTCDITNSVFCDKDNDDPNGTNGNSDCPEIGAQVPPLYETCTRIETCQGVGAAGLFQEVGADASPSGGADLLLLFDFAFWLSGAEQQNAVMVTQPCPGCNPFLTYWPTVGPLTLASWGAVDWEPVQGCVEDFTGDGTECDFVPLVNPGSSGGSGGPPGAVEVAIPLSALPGFDPTQGFRYTMSVTRGDSSLDYSPSGAHEDALSEAVAGATTTTLDNCPGMGAVTTECEIADGSIDSFHPRTPLAHEGGPGGRNAGLTLSKAGGGNMTLNWAGSCSPDDSDYSVYEGTIGVWTDHIPVPGLCTTGGLTTATFGIPVADSYYLVVPNDSSTEGSYGLDDISGERPVSTQQCVPQSLGNCP